MSVRIPYGEKYLIQSWRACGAVAARRTGKAFCASRGSSKARTVDPSTAFDFDHFIARKRKTGSSA
jgi:hypothetical protein